MPPTLQGPWRGGGSSRSGSGEEDDRGCIGAWPYPVKIYSLGGFRILRDDEPVGFGGKAQLKPLGMLKALIAMRGQDVSVRQLADSLWPDAEGDRAQKTFEMTLLRLRKLLDREGAVRLQGGIIGLDPRFCWVDAQAFDFISRRALAAWKDSSEGGMPERAADAVSLSEKALEMYRGPFLPNDSDLDCTAGMRERLRNLALQLAGSLGGHWEAKRQWQKAIGCYRKGIETDRLCEDFYRRLMICCGSQGENAEALRVYERCRSVLSSELGIEPSPKTQEVYDLIRRG